MFVVAVLTLRGRGMFADAVWGTVPPPVPGGCLWTAPVATGVVLAFGLPRSIIRVEPEVLIAAVPDLTSAEVWTVAVLSP